jgi:hypothetical protein
MREGLKKERKMCQMVKGFYEQKFNNYSEYTDKIKNNYNRKDDFR